jgi:NADH-quinone oxidoreductase subunit L
MLHNITLTIVIAPLVGSLLAGLWGKKLGRQLTHWVTNLLVGFSFIAAIYLAKLCVLDGMTYNGQVYTWGVSGTVTFSIGFLIDQLSSLMILTVTFISLLVHIYSIGYMRDDPGYQRFFSYISLFTFSMLMLVTANNFLQIFFGWEAVGVVSYLLIGFWFKREAANFGSLKAFLVNRVGDFGFLLGISAVVNYFGTVDFATIFDKAPELITNHTTISILGAGGASWSIITVICLLLFIGAMGKSAQVPLHVWLPESMEGPTPISALIHAATMVTAGIYMVSRMSPLFELSEVALSFVLVIGATGALFTGLVAMVQHDIKRVVAYSTLSQLGYMTAALGASAFSAGMFHLITHACFKALLFLGAGSVIMACHHNQDMRTMGNLKKYMPITYVTFLLGALSLSGIPPFSGFYSKEAIIEAVHLTAIPGASYAYFCVLIGAFVTPLYIFRALFLTFHTDERMDAETKSHLHESPAVVWVPLVVLAIPSVILGGMMVSPMLYQTPGFLAKSVTVAPQYDVLSLLAGHFHGVAITALMAVKTLPFWFAVAGIMTAWFTCVHRPHSREEIIHTFPLPYKILVNKYGFDDFNQIVWVNGGRALAHFIYRVGDVFLIDHFIVNGSAKLVNWTSKLGRRLQTGYLYHYVFAMIVGLLIFLMWLCRNYSPHY